MYCFCCFIASCVFVFSLVSFFISDSYCWWWHINLLVVATCFCNSFLQCATSALSFPVFKTCLKTFLFMWFFSLTTNTVVQGAHSCTCHFGCLNKSFLAVEYPKMFTRWRVASRPYCVNVNDAAACSYYRLSCNCSPLRSIVEE